MACPGIHSLEGHWRTTAKALSGTGGLDCNRECQGDSCDSPWTTGVDTSWHPAIKSGREGESRAWSSGKGQALAFRRLGGCVQL